MEGRSVFLSIFLFFFVFMDAKMGFFPLLNFWVLSNFPYFSWAFSVLGFGVSVDLFSLSGIAVGSLTFLGVLLIWVFVLFALWLMVFFEMECWV